MRDPYEESRRAKEVRDKAFWSMVTGQESGDLSVRAEVARFESVHGSIRSQPVAYTPLFSPTAASRPVAATPALGTATAQPTAVLRTPVPSRASTRPYSHSPAGHQTYYPSSSYDSGPTRLQLLVVAAVVLAIAAPFVGLVVIGIPMPHAAILIALGLLVLLALFVVHHWSFQIAGALVGVGAFQAYDLWGLEQWFNPTRDAGATITLALMTATAMSCFALFRFVGPWASDRWTAWWRALAQGAIVATFVLFLLRQLEVQDPAIMWSLAMGATTALASLGWTVYSAHWGHTYLDEGSDIFSGLIYGASILVVAPFVWKLLTGS